ncbi:ABC transporter permease [Microlunatus sp. GCM10028923]|uniref:ABC transporter permease n=1 Tax=Microlunatus sp. GCM10028923 TaxID=3273400 RepID=UPI0036200A62
MTTSAQLDDQLVAEPVTAASRFDLPRWRELRPGLTLAVAFLALLLAAVLAPGLLAPHDPLAVDPARSFLAPGGDHLLGTDESGRDVLSRMIHGARLSLMIGISATVIAVAGGTLLGLLAGLSHRIFEAAVMRFIDVALAVPELLLALVVITLLGGGTQNAIWALGIGGIPYYARMVRAQAHVVRRATYVEAATALGLPRWRVIVRHILPNSIKPVLILATIGVGAAIGAGASLSFLGLGAAPPSPEWGATLSVGRNFISNAPWLVVVPAVTLTLTVVSITVVGRELRRRSEGRTGR